METPTQPRLRAFSAPKRRARQYQRWWIIVGGVALLALFISAVGLYGVSRLASPSTRIQASVTPTATATGGAPWTYNPTKDNSTAQIIAGERAAAIQATAQDYLNHMSLDEKLGQMFLIETYYQTWTPDIANMVVGMHAGAVIIYAKNMQTPQQLQSYIASMQAHATIPLLVTMDEEGGLVDRLGYNHFFAPLPSAQWLGSSGSPKLATQAGAQAAQEMLEMGINTDLAPVVDVRGPNGSVETTRLYGDTSSIVETYAGAYLNGLQNNGVIGTLKHWPGIGDVIQDPHLTLPTITDSLTQMQSQHFATFRALLADDPGMIMVTHVIVNEIDPTMPATLSPKLVDGVLRGQLGYDGVVMTDSLYMQGIAVRYNLPEAGVLSVIAGDDLLEGAFDTNSMQAMISALKAAIASGRISVGRINQSVMRILKLKIRFGMLPLHDTHYHRVGQAISLAPESEAALLADLRRNAIARPASA
jgi:beta-N-acetylhexosaminidase